VFALLTPLATIYAECVGVLDGSERSANQRTFGTARVSGWKTRDDCEQALTQKLTLDSEKDTGIEVTVERQAGRPRLWVRRKGVLAVDSYGRLPDTVDPRGPKEK
jgi:hypothetical protein